MPNFSIIIKYKFAEMRLTTLHGRLVVWGVRGCFHVEVVSFSRRIVSSRIPFVSFLFPILLNSALRPHCYTFAGDTFCSPRHFLQSVRPCGFSNFQIFGFSEFQIFRLSDFYGTLLDPTGPYCYWTLLDPIEPYWTLLNPTEPYWTFV